MKKGMKIKIGKILTPKYRYAFTVEWSVEDEEFVGKCKNYPSISYLHPKMGKALKGIVKMVTKIHKADYHVIMGDW